MTLTDELHETFLFERLTDGQLQALAAAGTSVSASAGETIIREGEPADFLWVLLDGELELSRHVSGQKIVLLTTDRKGVYAGGFRAYGEAVHSGYRATIRALQPTRMFQLPASELARLLWDWFPMGKHLLDGLFQTVEWIDSMVRERESLVALGTMAAGLAHELNNPAAAAVPAGNELRSTMNAMRAGVQELAGGDLSRDQLQTIFSIQTGLRETPGAAPSLDALGVADLEDEVADWLQDHGLSDGWQLAPTLVGAGLDASWLEQIGQDMGPTALGPGLRWIACTLTAASLLDQLDDATKRISGLVHAVKEYTYMDRALVQDVDVREGLENTLTMLGYKLREGVEVTREYDPDLPHIEAHGSELNQVWLNLIDNAIDAMDGHGEIRICTARDRDGVLVEIADNGPGVPDEIQRRVFEPFFTTKEPGKGTGLGLDIVRRIVTEHHGGDLSLDSVPGNTRFKVRLPLRMENAEP